MKILNHKKHIVIIFPHFLIMGGAERFIVDIANNLAENGLSVKICTTYIDHKFLNILNSKIELKTLYKKLPNKFLLNRLNPLYIINIWSLSKNIGKNNTIISSIWPSQLIKFFDNFKNTDNIYFNICFEPNYLIHRYEPIPNTILNFSHRSPLSRFLFYLSKPLLIFFSILDKYSMHSHTKVLTLSNFVKKQVLDVYGESVSKKTFPILFDYVNFNNFHKKSIDINYIKIKYGIKINYSHILLSVSRIEKTKKIDIIIDAVQKLIAIDPNVLLLIGGVGSFTNIIKKKIIDLNLSSNVLMIGYLSDEDLLNIYNFADVFIYAGNAETSGPLTILESMACKTPVICAASGGPLEIVQNGYNGLLFEADNIEDLKSKLIDILYRNNKLSTEMVDNGYEYCLKYHDIKKLGSILRNVIDSC
jgi:glycosyltransferase involved in cell wall biosynthesis